MKLMLFGPELYFLLGGLLLFLITLGKERVDLAKNTTIAFSIIGIVVCIAALRLEGDLFYNAYRVDLFSQLFKLAIAIGFAIFMLFGRNLKGVTTVMKPEYFLFLSISCLGLMMLVSSVELLSLFVALELSSFALYLLVPMRDENTGVRYQMESAIKYILFGVMATGIMLFGMSYLYGLTGTTYLNELLPALHGMYSEPAAMIGIAMVMGGFFYKLGVFPFHFWVPDVYQGASNETTSFIASLPKLGAVALLIRITALVSPQGEVVTSMLMVLSICSMFYGNLSALVQTDIKRMLGFSGIAHAGFVLLGLITLKDSGYTAAMYYIFGYVMMNLACFLVISSVSKEGENLNIEDFRGLYKRAPLMAFTLLVGMFALAGIPPFVGFMGKFMLLASALNEGYLALVIIAAINTAISIYYYLSVVRVTYCTSPEEQPAVKVDFMTKAVSVTLVVIIIALGLAPAQILAVAGDAVKAIL